MKHVPAALALTLLWGACDKDASKDASARAIDPPYNSCKLDSDCAWGELDHEVQSAKDCVCLYGCPYLPLAKTTVDRRLAQHDKLCDPRRDGEGKGCGIDDCVQMPAIACVQEICAATDAGRER